MIQVPEAVKKAKSFLPHLQFYAVSGKVLFVCYNTGHVDVRPKGIDTIIPSQKAKEVLEKYADPKEVIRLLSQSAWKQVGSDEVDCDYLILFNQNGEATAVMLKS